MKIKMPTIASTTNIEGTTAAMMTPLSFFCDVETVGDVASEKHGHWLGTLTVTVEFDLLTCAVSFDSTRPN